MEEEFTLTDEQVANWRSALVTMPLPPFGLALRGYALIMPREHLVDVVKKLNEYLTMEEKPELSVLENRIHKILHGEASYPNITRTRPRKPGPVRR